MAIRSNLLKRGFVSLVVTQFFGAANDNILKGVLTFMVIDGAWRGELGKGGQGIVALCFTLPFILLSGYAGQFADRNSKQFVTVLVKCVEIPVAIIAFVGFATGNLWVTLSSLVFLTCQSAFFGPAKYGMIPELAKPEELSRANGAINMLTNIAVIVGTLAAGIIADRYAPPQGVSDTAQTSLPGLVLVSIAILGLGAALFLPKLQAGDRNLSYDANPLGTYISALKEMAKSPLLGVALAWGYFYLLAGIALLIIPEYTVVWAAEGVTREEASMILGVMGIAIGAGSVCAGLLSGHRIEPRLIPIGAIGLTAFFALLGLVPAALAGDEPRTRVLLSNVSWFVFGAGFCAGFYIIPLQAMLQHLSPDDERGRFLGTANGISFGFLSIASLVYWVIRPWFGERPERIFLVSSILMLGGLGWLVYSVRRRDLRERLKASLPM